MRIVINQLNHNEVYLSEKYPFIGRFCHVVINGLIYRVKRDPNLTENQIGLNHLQVRELSLPLTSSVAVKPVSDKEIICISEVEVTLEVRSIPLRQLQIHEGELIEELMYEWKETKLFANRTYMVRHQNVWLALKLRSSNHILVDPEKTTFHLVSKYPEKIVIFSQDKSVTQFSKKSLEELGIGGLQSQYQKILRRIFASRLLDQSLMESLGLKHVKGLILYGPPGTGKSLLSKKFSQLISNVEPKVVNGPEILNKYVGQSEENIRKLFDEAEHDNSGKIHVIIFDEFDAICRERGRGTSSRGDVTDSLVNQLLALMDGIKSLENILVIGITNRKELLDPALLRPGRFELQLEIGLPDLKGRRDIFNIYLKPYQAEGCLAEEIDYEKLLDDLANRTPNYTGAEIAGIVRSAVSFAMNRQIDWDAKKKMINEISLTMEDLNQALIEVKPQWSGCQGKIPGRFQDFSIDKSLIEEIVSRLNAGRTILIVGGPKSGKTQTLTAVMEKTDPTKYLLYVNNDLSSALSSLDVVVPDYLCLDDILDLVKYIPLGCRYHSELVLKCKDILKGNLPVVATTSDVRVVDSMGLLDYFDYKYQVGPEKKSRFESGSEGDLTSLDD